MTLPYSERRTSTYIADGVQKVFEFPFRVFYDSDTGNQGLEVRQDLELDYSIIPESDYQVSFNEEMIGGRVEFYNAPAAGTLLYIAGSTPADQMLNIANYSRFSGEAIETGMDKIVAIIQEWFSGLSEERRQRILGDANVINVTDQRYSELKSWIMQEFPNIAEATFDNIFQEFYQQWQDALSQINQNKFPALAVIDSSGKDQQQINDKIKRELTSVWDFFTVAELGEYRSSPNTFDAARPLQAFFDYISANNIGRATCDAELWVKSAVKLGGAAGTLTKHIQGYLKITAINTSLTATPPIENLFTFQPASNLRWEGVIHLVGSSVNALNYDRRHVRNGILLGGEYSATHSSIDFIIAENGFKEWGIIQGNLTTGLVIGKIRGTRSGTGYVVGGYVASLYSEFTKVSDEAGTGTQRTTISVTNFPDYKTQVGYVVINNESYLITSKNEAAKTLEIFPILPSGVTAGNLKYAFGGVYHTTGGDASVANVGNINCSTSGISVQLSALYPPTIGSITSQNNFCVLSLGSSISAGLEAGTIDELYCEAAEFDIIQNTRYANTNITIANNVGLDLDKCLHVGNYRKGDNTLDQTYLLGVTAGYNSAVVQAQGLNSANTLTVPIFSANTSPVISPVFTQNKVVNLTEGKKSLYRLFGYSNRTIKFANATGNVLQSITFNPPAGYTLNNQSGPVVFSNIGGSPVFEVIYHGGVNVTVNLVGKTQSTGNSVTYDPPSISASGTTGDSVTTTVTLSGAAIGNPVQAAFTQYNSAIEISAQVSAANTVTVKFKNTSAAAVDLPSGTLTVKTI